MTFDNLPELCEVDLFSVASGSNEECWPSYLVLCPLGEKLWWADQGTDQIGTCDKKDGGNWKVLRNSTSPMMHMKIYNETVQKGAGTCHLFFWAL